MSLHLFKNVFECIISSILTFRNNNSLFYDITRLVVSLEYFKSRS